MEMFLLKSGEMALKGLNKSRFEDILIKNARKRLEELGSFKITKAQSTIYIRPASEPMDYDEVELRLKKLFGISAVCRSKSCEKNIDAICATAITYLRDQLWNAKSFKVEARRSDKGFSLNSMEICKVVGHEILQQFPHLSVDVHKPELKVFVEVRETDAYIHAGNMLGAGGMPVGSSGRAALMMSGGIDSPVAGYMMARRGLEIVGVHFESPPYTSVRAKLKVIELANQLSEYSGRIQLYIVQFTKIQELIKTHCDNDYFTIIMRRYMCKITDGIAKASRCQAIITGESLAQVASQTMEALACTDVASEMPIFRPLIGMDKRDIVEVSKQIGTYETSILPYEDCCTVFTPKHPKTKPKLEAVLNEEKKLEKHDIEMYVKKAIEESTYIMVE